VLPVLIVAWGKRGGDRNINEEKKRGHHHSHAQGGVNSTIFVFLPSSWPTSLAESGATAFRALPGDRASADQLTAPTLPLRPELSGHHVPSFPSLLHSGSHLFPASM